MTDRRAPGADAERWLALFRRSCDEIWRQVGPMSVAERREPMGRGAGGDETVRIDRVAEDIVVAELERRAAEIGGLTLVSEEAGRVWMGADLPLVVLDPIDGSLNAKRGLPTFATAIAVAHTGATIGDVWLGFVRDHATGEDIVAERGRGAWINGAALPPVAGDGTLELLLLEGAAPERVARAAAAIGDRAGRLRALGSLALSICAVAAGRGDALVSLGRGRSVDYAAAQLVARETGILIGLPTPEDLDQAPLDTLSGRHIVAARDAGTLAFLLDLLPAGTELFERHGRRE